MIYTPPWECLRFPATLRQGANVICLICPRAGDLPHAYTGSFTGVSAEGVE